MKAWKKKARHKARRAFAPSPEPIYWRVRFLDTTRPVCVTNLIDMATYAPRPEGGIDIAWVWNGKEYDVYSVPNLGGSIRATIE